MTLLSYLADPEGSDSFRHHRLMCWSDYSQQEKHPTDPSDQAHQPCKNPKTGIGITSTLQKRDNISDKVKRLPRTGEHAGSDREWWVGQ